MPARTDIHKILVIGSGPIVIGQACEFDYSGTQAVQALREEGYEVVLVNPNPATVMTTPGIADAIYLEPLTVPYVTDIIARERPDAILTTMGGQTGLNLTIELHKKGILDTYGVQVIGAGINSIELAEDRRLFKEIITSLGLESARSVTVKSVAEAEAFKKIVGLPLILRPSFTLGGMGGGIIRSEEEFHPAMKHALEASPVGEVLVEESLLGWKEFELEVMRDKNDNAIIVCSIENVDPMGVHTGDSITVAPIQTLSDQAYQKMRTASIDILRAIGVDCGGSNVQFAVQPGTGRMVVIEMNPRVSRSSALASKATGFPIARCSAKLAIGFTLDEVLNEITGMTRSCFEPALDYVSVKIPRFELEKFPMPDNALGTQMKSVGEALAMGRTLLEAMNKAFRAIERGLGGILPLEDVQGFSADDVDTILHCAHPYRFLAAYSVLRRTGESGIAEVSAVTGYDSWFLYQLVRLADREQQLVCAGRTIVDSEQRSLLMEAKRDGIADERIASLCGVEADEISVARKKQGIVAVRHYVDTCAGEIAASTPYCYTTYGEQDEGSALGEDAMAIIASGPNRIGQGLEFDTCCTMSSLALRKLGHRTIMINSNPETVSTDFNISDRLYVEPLTPEHVLRVLELEKTRTVVLQLGGQTPLNMMDTLVAHGVKVVGTSPADVSIADDRGKFAALIRKLGLHQSENRTAYSPSEVMTHANEVGYPVLLRPSHVLGGRNMFIAFDDDAVRGFLDGGVNVSSASPLLVDKFLEDAFEYDLDAVSDGTSLYIGGILQHIEAAGIHSGDSAAVFPPYKSTPEVLNAMRKAALDLACALSIKGFMNIQFAVKDGQLYVIEVNPRASRTVPFISKASGVDLVEVAVRVWEGEDLVTQGLVDKKGGVGEGSCRYGWAIKESVFSFDRFADIDPQLGPEMKSTGEVIGMGTSFGEAFAKSQIGAGNSLPTSGRVCISVNRRDRATIIPIVRKLHELGFELAATRGTARDLYDAGILCETVLKVHEGHPNISDHLMAGRIDLMINTPMGSRSKESGESLRMVAMRQRVPYTTTTSAASAAVQAIEYLQSGSRFIRKLDAPLA
ncbi:carbamoyl-phosphate synthase large subunit [Parasphaerochaeta coccoides]|uniref:Carbamoyl-phosphate synthase large subunit n=1 Tax=Parasphaerochaeta coccoides (strain ATCC BAA-1237 / DSM 17374 / SPN1) TaxID=760011 RepID=F4GL97_PARC1|nr:carbamoyl-phosphate synthase large subunit [Parasphaerochaeta coccoides]AEC02929.1 carbamoyl-phosphate synthase large subunit [Parasphaerochaeta coccoides DSM 17374]